MMNPTPTSLIQASGQQRQPGWRRWGLGGLLFVFSLASLVVTATSFCAEYGYNSLNKLQAAATENVNDKQALTQYALHLERLLRLDPTNGEIESQYASVNGRLGDYDRAIASLNRARLTFNTQRSLSFLADMDERKGAIREADALMADCVRINPTDTIFHPMRLRILNKQLIDLKAQQRAGMPVNATVYQAASRAYGEAAENWLIRAWQDKNAYLFLGQYNVELKNYLYAYRSYLIGLSQASWLTMNRKETMIQPQAALGTVGQILNGHFAKPYKDLPFGGNK